jgi:hypothetical protein
MAVYCLESLVLRGVSVLCGGKALNTRLGASVATDMGIPAVGNSMSQSPSDARPDYAQPADGPTPQVLPAAEEPVAGGAGRSHCAGVHHRRRFPATPARKASPFGQPAHGLQVVGRGKRTEVGSSWQLPAARTLPTTRGTRDR